MAARPLAGRIFGRLTVISLVENRKPYHWKCQCSCGNEIVVCSSSLGRKKRPTRSCGCIRIHKQSNQPTYRSWMSMLARCYNPSRHSYPLYGGRGIRVCDSWKKSFATFFSDMGPRPEGTTLDRINVNGDYCMSNCRWATASEQARNRQNNTYVVYCGQRMLAIEAAELIGVSPNRIYGWAKKWTDISAKANEVLKNSEPNKSLIHHGGASWPT